MRNLVRLMMAFSTVAALAQVAACSKPPVIPSPVTVSRPSPVTSAKPIPVPNRATATKALITAADLGKSYSSTSAALSPATQMGTSLDECANASADRNPEVNVEAVYQGSTVGPFVAETVTVSTEAHALRTMKALTKVTANCGRFGSTMAGGTNLTVAINEITFPQVGEDSIAFQLTMSLAGAGGAQVYADMVTARVANVVVIVALIQLSAPDEASMQRIVESAMNKVRARLFA